MSGKIHQYFISLTKEGILCRAAGGRTAIFKSITAVSLGQGWPSPAMYKTLNCPGPEGVSTPLLREPAPAASEKLPLGLAATNGFRSTALRSHLETDKSAPAFGLASTVTLILLVSAKQPFCAGRMCKIEKVPAFTAEELKVDLKALRWRPGL